MISAINRFASNAIFFGEKSKQGMTIVEVLISLLIVAGVLGGNAALFAKCNIFSTELKERTIVNNALNEGMEKIRDMPFGFIAGLSSCPVMDLSDLNNATCLPEVDPALGDTDGKIFQVTLKVDWNSPQGRSTSKSLSAYFTESGIN